mmetsp:Transcript_1114/g.2499  ORF Transcript_1114/g.2499 Transcript_1114/m.2499 type:complete len:94 (-) Transcript_1114:798-1079(-)
MPAISLLRAWAKARDAYAKAVAAVWHSVLPHKVLGSKTHAVVDDSAYPRPNINTAYKGLRGKRIANIIMLTAKQTQPLAFTTAKRLVVFIHFP